jgi:hypothetical protein
MMKHSGIPLVLVAEKSRHLVARYEELRCRALGGGGGLGLTLFLRHGMKAWIETWSDCAVHVPKAPSNDSDLTVPSQLHAEIAMLLAGMTLNTQIER